jgi:transcriptional regulator with XRE-family HTH domain
MAFKPLNTAQKCYKKRISMSLLTKAEMGSRIKKIRGKNSQTDFAKLAGIPKNTLGRYERGEIMPGAEPIASLCAATGVDPYWLLFGEGSMDRCDASIEVDSDHEHLRMEYDRLKEQLDQLLFENETMRSRIVEMEIGRERDFIVSVVVLAGCSPDGWGQKKATVMYVVAPPDIAKTKSSFAVSVVDDGMIQAGIQKGHLLFCDPKVNPLPGDIVFVELIDGSAAIKIYLGENKKDGHITFTLESWLPSEEASADQIPNPLSNEINAGRIKMIAPVIYIRRRT